MSGSLCGKLALLDQPRIHSPLQQKLAGMIRCKCIQYYYIAAAVAVASFPAGTW
jgi:hypothetical protein